MLRHGLWAILSVATMIGTTAAYADVPPPPGTLERLASEAIKRAGYECPSVVSLAVAVAEC